MARPSPFTFPNDPPVLGSPNFGANAQGYLGAFPGLTQYIEAMADYFESDFAKLLANGSAAAPSMAFETATDTGFYLDGSGRLGASVGGVMRTLLSSTAYQVDVPITGAAVQNSSSDLGDGKVALVNYALNASLSQFGDYRPVTTPINIDTEVNGGFAGLVSTANAGTWPPGVSTFVWLSCQKIYSGQSVKMTLVSGYSGTTAPNSFQIYTRLRSDSGAWGAWAREYNSLNSVGTVSQSGGVPTGALFQYGSNANGEFVRLADGTQICTTRRTASATDPAPWVFPAAFSGAAPTISGAVEAGAASRIFTYGNLTTTSINFWTWNGAVQVGSQCSILATGRWF